MKLLPRLSICAALLVAVFGVTKVSAQTGDVKEPPVETRKPVKEEVDTGDSPIRISRIFPTAGGEIINRAKPSDENNVGYRVHNPGEKMVRAYAALLINGREKDVKMGLLYGKLVDTDQLRLGAYIFPNTDRPVWSFDWILFDDGTTWGPDEYGRSKEILDYLRGRQTAIDRAKELTGYSDSHPLKYIIDFRGSMWSTYSLSPFVVRKPRSETDDFDRGYDSVVKNLLYDADRNKRDLSRQIAEALEKQAAKIPTP